MTISIKDIMTLYFVPQFYHLWSLERTKPLQQEEGALKKRIAGYGKVRY